MENKTQDWAAVLDENETTFLSSSSSPQCPDVYRLVKRRLDATHDPVSHVLVSDCLYTGLEATYATSQGLLVSVRN